MGHQPPHYVQATCKTRARRSFRETCAVPFHACSVSPMYSNTHMTRMTRLVMRVHDHPRAPLSACQAGLRGPRVGAPEVSHAHPCPIRAQYSRASVRKSALSRAPTVPARMDSCTADAGVRTSRANLIRRLVISLQGRAVSYSSSQKRKSRYHSCGQPGLAVNASRHRTVTRSLRGDGESPTP
jgi:hypothetical protein